MNYYKQKVVETAEFLKSHIKKSPEICILTGTGLGECVESLNVSTHLEYKDIPNFSVSTVQSHLGRMLAGSMEGRQIIAMQGRFHLYEGYTPLEVSFSVRVMQELGAKILILSNVAGGLNLGYEAGDIMIIADHINLTGSNPLVGLNEETWGNRFPDMSNAYDNKLMGLAEGSAKKTGIHLQKGVYAGLKGPSLETPAEVRFLKTIGADAVGFSTVQEVIVAVHSGMRMLGLSTITNVHNPDAPAPATVEEIIAVANGAAPKLETIIKEVVRNLDDRELS